MIVGKTGGSVFSPLFFAAAWPGWKSALWHLKDGVSVPLVMSKEVILNSSLRLWFLKGQMANKSSKHENLSVPGELSESIGTGLFFKKRILAR